MGFLSKLFGGGGEKPKCPICGREMGFFSKTELADGAICDQCVARAQSLIGDRLIAEMSVGAVKAAVAEEDEINAKLAAAFGGEYPNLFKVEFSHPISPKATDVGIRRAGAMKNAIAAKGVVVSGSFDKGEAAVIRVPHPPVPAQLIESAPFTEGEAVDSTLAAHLYKGAVGAGKTAWLILDGNSGVTSGDLIGMK